VAGMLQMRLSKLYIWNRSVDLAKKIHDITKLFPHEERYGLTSQMRRAGVSIPSNIAEGSQRTSNKEFANFILIAKGSLAEVETQILLSKKYGYISENTWKEVQQDIEELHRMLHTFHSKLVTRNSQPLFIRS
jgi:four helix bundle protein